MTRKLITALWYLSSAVVCGGALILLALIFACVWYPANWMGTAIQATLTCVLIASPVVVACAKYIEKCANR